MLADTHSVCVCLCVCICEQPLQLRNVQHGSGLFLSFKSCNKGQQLPPTLLHCLNQAHLIRGHAPWVVITNNHYVATHTVFLQLPVAVHLSLSLNPVAAVCPEGGLGLSNDSSA